LHRETLKLAAMKKKKEFVDICGGDTFVSLEDADKASKNAEKEDK